MLPARPEVKASSKNKKSPQPMKAAGLDDAQRHGDIGGPTIINIAVLRIMRQRVVPQHNSCPPTEVASTAIAGYRTARAGHQLSLT